MKKKWWHSKTAYQIYPKSFRDSNGDGIGDLQGIIEKLDYLKELGVGIVWISPIYQSPFVDQGYDISDYYAIDPAFGTMEDMDELLREAKKRDIAIVMDLVVNHCSDQHAWFQEALKDPFGPYGAYFYIREGRDGQPPCNWRSYFGGSVWEKLPGYDNLFYLHMFAKEQPDLNWENPLVRQEIYQMIRWWLEKGVAGFRLDAVINIKKDLRFLDFPADREDGLCAGTAMLACAEGVTDFLQEMKREAFAPYDAFTIGELFDFRTQELERYIGEDGCFSSIFDFAPHLLGASGKGWYDRQSVSMDEFRDAVSASKALSQEIGMMANIIENHDEPRGASRYLPMEGQSERGKKLLAGISLMTFGLPFLYQGQEIGMTNKQFCSIEEVDDISTLDEYQTALSHGLTETEALGVVSEMSRDNARTPMQWSSEVHGGFTTGTPWLSVNENYREINVVEQEGRRDSVLSFYKKLIALRTDPDYGEAVVYGRQEPALKELQNFTAFYRKGKEKTLLVLANVSGERRSVETGTLVKRTVLNNCEAEPCMETAEAFEGKSRIWMEGYQFLVLEVYTFMNQKAYWNQVSAGKEFTTPFHIAEFEKYVGRDARILDVGCGYGRTLQELYESGFHHLTGIDFSKGMIERGRAQFPHLDLRVQESEKIDFPDESVDAVLLFAVLTCIWEDSAQEALVREIGRVLKPGGILYVNDFLINEDERNQKRYAEYAPRYGTYGVFELPEGAVLRHHDETWIHSLLSSFQTLQYEHLSFTTMNGNRSNGFYFLGKKTSVCSC